MTVCLQDAVWMILYRNKGQAFRLTDLVEEVGEIWPHDHLGSAAVNACLDRLVRSGDVQKFTASNGASLFQATTTT